MRKILFLLFFMLLSLAVNAQNRPFKFDKLLIKTNLLADMGTVTNLGAEININDRYTFDLPVYYSPYTIKEDFKLRVFIIQPEVKYWFKSKPFDGHYFGLNISTGWYNVALNKKTRYQDNKMVMGVGLTYGYYYPLLDSNFILGVSVGVGYNHFSYNKYRNSGAGEYIGNGRRNYYGITQAAFTLAYRIDLK